MHKLWCNQLNGRQPVDDVLATLPLERVWEIHLAGGDAVDGYWLDAHSGLVPDPLMELCRTWFPRLPNLKAVIFEIIPDYLASKDMGLDVLLAQLEAIRVLWNVRGSRLDFTRSEEHTSELQSLMRISYAVFCLKKK